MSARERIAWLDVAKGWSILSVAFYHSTLYLGEYGLAAETFEDVNTVLMPVRMPLFFAVSGVLAASAVHYSWRMLIEKRLWVFAYLLLVWTSIRWAYFSAIQTNVRSPAEGSSLFELAYFWVAPSTGLWFIWALGIFFVLGKLGSGSKRVAFSVVCIVSLMSYTGIVGIENFAQRNAVRYAPFFLGGAWFGRDVIQWLAPHYKPVGVISAIGFIIAVALMLMTSGRPSGLFQVIASIGGLGFGASVSIALSNTRLFGGMLSFVGRNTLPIYVSHVLIVAAVSAALAAVAAELPGISVWAVPATMGIAVSAALLIEALCNRVGLRWLYSAPPLPTANSKTTSQNVG